MSLSRSVRLNKDQAAKFSREQVMEVRVDARRDNFHLLLGEDFLLRIKEKSPEPKIVKNQISDLIKIKNLVNPRQQQALNEIIAHDRFIKDKINEDIRRSNSSYAEFDDQLTVFKKRWAEIEKLQHRLGLNVLRPDSLYFCDKCYAFRVGRSLTAKVQRATPLPPRCDICNLSLSKRKRIRCLPDAISDFLGGKWLEWYVSSFLERAGWRAWSSIYVYGSSGSELEVDILALKKGYTLIAECKSGSVGLRDVTTFISKFHEIKCNYALFASLVKTDEKIVKMMTKNPAFYVLNGCRLDSEIVKQIKKIGV